MFSLTNDVPATAPLPLTDDRPATLADALRALPWWNQLAPEEQARVDADCQERRFEAGSYVCRRGGPGDHWIGVVDGLLKMSNVSREGKLVTFTGLPAGAWFGEGTVLKRETRKYDVVALRDSRTAFLPGDTFEWLLARSIPFNRYLLAHLNERLGQFIGMVEFDRLLDPDARIARCLGSLIHPILYPGHGMTLRISQEEIGHLAGVSRQRANQALQRLEREQLLAVEYGGFRILDLERLRQYGA